MPFAGAIADFARRGFTESLSVAGNRLRVLPSARTFGPEDVVTRSYRRFEGVSDPDDMAIVYAIETEGGIRGTLADAYGVLSHPDKIVRIDLFRDRAALAVVTPEETLSVVTGRPHAPG